jgi:hypothetical protein
MDYLKESLDDKTDADPSFPAQLRSAALKALETDDSDLLRRGLTALAFVGRIEDATVVDALTQHADADVAKDARTSLFEIRRCAE